MTVFVFRRTWPIHDGRRFLSRIRLSILPALFVLVAAAVVLSVVSGRSTSASRGGLLLAAGIPLFYWFNATPSPRRPAVHSQHHDDASISRALHGVGENPAVRRASISQEATSVRAGSTNFRESPTRSQFEGHNENGYGPLLDSIAAAYGVDHRRVTTAQGASGANFLVFAALLDPGDEVLVETPGYDPLLGAPLLLGARVNQFQRTSRMDSRLIRIVSSTR